MCKIYHDDIGHGELDRGSRDLAACWLAVLAAKEHVEIWELFTRTGKRWYLDRQIPSVINTRTHTLL